MTETSKARLFVFGLTVVSYAAAWMLAYLVNLNINAAEFIELASISLGFAAVFVPLCHWRKIPSLQSAVEIISLGLILTGPIIIFTYIAASIDQPLQDQHLLQMDQRLGVDWHALTAFIDAHALLSRALVFAYRSFLPQLLLLPILLAITQRRARAYQMMGAYGLICIFASIISVWYPALGTYAALSVDIYEFKNIDGSLAVASVPQFAAARSDPNFILHLAQTSGIVTFPSVHAAVAVLCAWAAWSFKWGRWPFVLLNLVMLCSAVPEGGHYVVDLISGIGVAGFAIALVLCVTRSSFDVRVQRLERHPISSQADGNASG